MIASRYTSRAITFIVLIIFMLVEGCSVVLPAPSPAPSERLVRGAENIAPVASYIIEVTLDADNKTLLGRERVTYLNSSSNPIPDLVFHLYLNAFRSEETLFMREGGGQLRGFEWDEEAPGFIEVDNIQLLDGTPLQLELIEDGTLARASLPQPVPPGETVEVLVDFHAQLPFAFARTGFVGDDFFMVGQWFPKLGVWEGRGWNAYPHHANSEFYSDFGSYDVRITLPDNFITGGVGILTSQVDNGDGTQTVQYRAEQVIDFAWTASPNFRPARRRVAGVEILYLHLPEHAWTVDRALTAATAALISFGRWYGPYPYSRLTIVDVPDEGAGAGGMEYPTLVTAGTTSLLGVPLMGRFNLEKSLELTVIHEVGHQWWQSMVAFNEAEEPWLDEGFTDYSTLRLVNQLYGEGSSAVNAGDYEVGYLETRRLEYLALPRTAMFGNAWDFLPLQYGVAAYSKPGLSLLTLERVIGEDLMLRIMSTFFQRFQFAHPDTNDFRAVAMEVTGQSLDWFFDGLVYSDQVLNYQVAELVEDSVTVERQGELAIPTQIEVTFQDGTSVVEPWDGQEQERVFRYTDRPPIQRR